jgi:MarR family transcriptional regulator, organic hydroperoxide resistance regulator
MSGMSIQAFAVKMTEIMDQAAREFTRQQNNELFKGHITLPQFVILQYLYNEGESNMTHLAELMNVSTAAMTGNADRLVRDGYIVRTFDEKDRRLIKVKLNAKGTNTVKRVREQRCKMIIKTFGKISDSDRASYIRILTQIRDILILEKTNKKSS